MAIVYDDFCDVAESSIPDQIVDSAIAGIPSRLVVHQDLYASSSRCPLIASASS